jgi:hypothetical protein
MTLKRCKTAGCTKFAKGATGHCKAHGGGNRCKTEGCTKSARSGTDHCIEHGGGNRCKTEGCTKSAQGATDHCIEHGGGNRCKTEGCTKSAARASDHHCIAHGGGKRCKTTGCTKSAVRATGHCKGHGGGKRCSRLDVHVEGSIDWPPPTVYLMAPAEGLCFGCHRNEHPEKHPWKARREHLMIAELHRLLPELEPLVVVQDCPVPGACSLLRPDLFYDVGRAWLALECDEGGLAHRETHGKYETFYRSLGERPILLVRVNSDPMFHRQFIHGVGTSYQGNERFGPMMEQVAQETSRLLAIAMGDEHIEQGVHTEMLFF